jgi:chromate transport protein ChrA
MFVGMISAVGIFLPGFIIISLLYTWFENLRRGLHTKKVLHVLHIAAIALLLRVIIDYSTLISSDIIRVVIVFVSVLLLLSKKVSPTLIITLSVLLGIILSFT